MDAPEKVRAPAQRSPASEGVLGAEGMLRAERALRIAADLFEVRAAAVVVADGEGLRIETAWARAEWREADAIDAARHLRDALDGTQVFSPASVLEDIAPGRGFRAAAPIPSDRGRGFGAVCLVDPDRRALLSGLQRRLLAEFGGLLLQTRFAGPIALNEVSRGQVA